ncbi:precursor of major core protein 4a, complexes with p4B [Squirrelpox virus]|uniref:Precursor of major core protein 4a, complexes with p4B n=1 Tax=Squirrelpox virus TaxID=240426 RepID=U3UBK3_9POXV|nr:precursor of major core protein 4a, complexes with p4B [Squirrelpox virus]CCD83281.1 precursor of major core protein 4a, complexes with p4B [Squirrelpox virus]
MIPINHLITLDQLESSEYLFRVVSTILPSLCLDYKVNPDLMHTVLHVFDALFNADVAKVAREEDLSLAVQQVGINYLLDMMSETRLFPASVHPGTVVRLPANTRLGDYDNPIPCTHSFNDLPPFTREMVKLRTTSFEEHARVFGGYVRAAGAPEIKSPVAFPRLSFENTYLLNLLYPSVIADQPAFSSGFRARFVDGVMLARDLANLLGVRALLTQASRQRFDVDFRLERAAADHGIVIAPVPAVDTELTTMRLKYLVLYFQYFMSWYDLGPLTFNGERVTSNRSVIMNFVAGLSFQAQLPEMRAIHSSLQTITLNIDTATAAGPMRNTINLPGVEFVDISARPRYYLTLLNVLARKARAPALTPKAPSLFWDGMDYGEYKDMKLSDVLFIGATCYVFGTFEHNGVTYCSVLNDVITSGRTPLRVCLLPRCVAGRTMPSLVAETLQTIDSVSPREFPRKPAGAKYTIGLSENGFMRFFQILRLMANRPQETAIKEVLLAYAGIKIDDNGSPYHIKRESYKEFATLLFAAMGFRVSTRRSVVSSHSYTTLYVSPRVTKSHIYNALLKSSCSKTEAEKLMSSAHELLHFMVSAGDARDAHGMRYSRRLDGMCPLSAFRGGAPDAADEGETLIQISEPLGLLDRIDVRGIFSAKTLNEMVDVDAFLPENIAFKRNLAQLIDSDQLSGETIAHAMPLGIIDRIVPRAGAGFGSVGELIDEVTDHTDDCGSTNEVVEVINNALRDNYFRDTGAVATTAIHSATARSEKQMDLVRQSACHMANIFKTLVRSIYTMERIFKVRITDEVKAEMLEKYKAFTDLSHSLYKDLVALEHLKALLYIVKRSGRYIDDMEVGSEDLRKAYDMIRPKISRMTNYYMEISRAYFEHMKKNLNMADADSSTFDTE